VSKRAFALVIGLVAFLGVVLGLLAWASWSGSAGTQRGFIIRSEIDEDTVVRMEDGRSEPLGTGRRQTTFVVRREEFPMVIGVYTPEGALRFERLFNYEDLAEAEFRYSYDVNGFYRTMDVRDTPIPTP
jgi:hypothetical protein